MKRYLFVLTTILADQERKTIMAFQIEGNASSWRCGFPFHGFTTFSLLCSFLCFFVQHFCPAHVASRLYFGLDQHNLRRILGEHEVCQQLFDGSEFYSVLLDLVWNKRGGTAQFVILVEHAVRVPHGIETRVKCYCHIRVFVLLLFIKIKVM